jgi:type IV pilus assembly protein PilV
MTQQPRRSLQHGFTLVEVLVALFIFAIAMLGSAGMQLSSLRSNQQAGNAAIATSLARDYGEMMQIVPGASICATCSTSTPFFMDTTTVGTSTTAAACTGTSNTCTPANMVSSYQQDFAKRVQAALPSGRVVVCLDSTPVNNDLSYSWSCDNAGDLVVVKVGWTGKNDTGETLFTADVPRAVVTLFGNVRDFVP